MFVLNGRTCELSSLWRIIRLLFQANLGTKNFRSKIDFSTQRERSIFRIIFFDDKRPMNGMVFVGGGEQWPALEIVGRVGIKFSRVSHFPPNNYGTFNFCRNFPVTSICFFELSPWKLEYFNCVCALFQNLI